MYEELIIVGVIGFLMGWSVSSMRTRKKLLKYVIDKQSHDEMMTPMKPSTPVIQIKVEQRNEELFAYQLSNGMFLGQADDGQGLVNKLAKRYEGKDVHITIHKDDGAEHVEAFFPKEKG